MADWIFFSLLALLCLNLLLLLWLVLRPQNSGPAREVERLERELRDELGRQGQSTRADLSSFQQMLLTQSGDVARTQNEQIDAFRVQLAATQQQTDAALRRFSDTLAEQLRLLSDGNERRLGEMRLAVETRLASLQEGNEKKLEQMRATVDEKLHATLEQRLGESFKQVADRLEQVHKGLGEMQTLAQGVGDLKHLLTNVKTRGVFGEVQLAGLLEQVFTPEQYDTNVATVPGSNELVEFAIRLPGKQESHPIWLPIDCKYPVEHYQRLMDAHDAMDKNAVLQAGNAFETSIKLEAKKIVSKYVSPPHTTDFAILYLPTEGLFAEVIRRPGLVEAIQNDCRVMITGPANLAAMLNSLQMGFKTLAIEKRSSEVWSLLGMVKTEFSKFGDIVDATKKSIDAAASKFSEVGVRTRAIQKKLRDVEDLPSFSPSPDLIPLPEAIVEAIDE